MVDSSFTEVNDKNIHANEDGRRNPYQGKVITWVSAVFLTALIYSFSIPLMDFITLNTLFLDEKAPTRTYDLRLYIFGILLFPALIITVVNAMRYLGKHHNNYESNLFLRAVAWIVLVLSVLMYFVLPAKTYVIGEWLDKEHDFAVDEAHNKAVARSLGVESVVWVGDEKWLLTINHEELKEYGDLTASEQAVLKENNERLKQDFPNTHLFYAEVHYTLKYAGQKPVGVLNSSEYIQISSNCAGGDNARLNSVSLVAGETLSGSVASVKLSKCVAETSLSAEGHPVKR